MNPSFLGLFYHILLKPLSLIGGDPLSWIAIRGSTPQALSHVRDGIAEVTLVMARCQSRVN
jgi:hypothetical protein